MAKSKNQGDKFIKVYALDPKYRRSPYPAVAAEDTRNGTFITGQHWYPGIQTDYLTVDEMTGKTDLTQAKRKKFPYVINPNDRIMIIHGSQFNVGIDEDGNAINPKDVATLNFIRLQEFVAPSKSEYHKGKHYFYIDDREKEAEINVTKADKEFDAMKLVYENSSLKKMREFCLLLQYYLKGFVVEFDSWSPTMIKERLLKAAKEQPDEVLKCGLKAAENDLYILKLAFHKIILRKSDGFFDGNTFLGANPREVFSLINNKDNEALASRCAAALTKAEEEVEE